MNFAIDGIQVTSLIIVFGIYLIAMITFLLKKRDPDLHNFIIVFFDISFLIGGFNVLYYAFTKQTLFEELSGQNLDLLIALAGLLMIALGFRKIYDTFKTPKEVKQEK
jgi:predicted transporter